MLPYPPTHGTFNRKKRRNETKWYATKHVNSHPEKSRFLAILHNNLEISCTVDSLALSLFLLFHCTYSIFCVFVVSFARLSGRFVFAMSSRKHTHTHTTSSENELLARPLASVRIYVRVSERKYELVCAIAHLYGTVLVQYSTVRLFSRYAIILHIVRLHVIR